MIQKPNINFTDAATIDMKDASSNSPFCLTENLPQKLDIIKGQNMALFP